jgi:LytS/YehU family sensor histidine kinase
MCEGLGDFLRLTLHLGGCEVVTLSEELALVDRYLAIEQVRFGERLKLERHVDPEALSCLLAPLLLQPLVENAVKHGVAGRSEGGTVCLEASLRDGRMIVALDRIARIEPYAKDSRIAVLRDGREIPVSRRGYARLRELMER